MKITKDSKYIIEKLVPTEILFKTKPKKSNHFFFHFFYRKMDDGFQYVTHTYSKLNPTSTIQVTHASQIPKPTTSSNYFPKFIKQHIEKTTKYIITYNISLFERIFVIHFAIENAILKPSILKKYNEYVKKMMVWLHILNELSNSSCSKQLTIFIYHTSFRKKLPESKEMVLDVQHVNTAYTTSCPKNDGQIIIYRMEEWFKVFIHETFHSFGLDFSEMDNAVCKTRILSLFSVSSKVNLYEAYTEFWARIINSFFVAYIIQFNSNKSNTTFLSFYTILEEIIQIEVFFSCFQMIKALKHMNLTYEMLYKKHPTIKHLYKENTNVLAYYIITFILMFHHIDFFEWCRKNNLIDSSPNTSTLIFSSILNFEKTTENQNKFCDFIEENYNDKHLLQYVHAIEEISISKTNQIKKKYHNINTFHIDTMRMTAFELS